MAPNKHDADDFINVWMDGEPGRPGAATAKSGNEFFDKWHAQSSAKLAIPPVTGPEALRAIYPNHSLVMTNGYTMGIMSFPAAIITPIEKSPLLTNLNFVPLPRVGEVPGVLVDNVEFGAFKITWTSYEYIMYIVHYPQGLGTVTQYFILHEGPEEVSRLFLLAAGSFTNALHDEIWVYDQNAYWRKDHSLWVEVQKANWDDVILDEEFKKALKKDVYGFFESKEIYKELSIPWKRGLIMYGPPGNGKTISLKTIMKECGALGYAPLYVKTFKTWKGEEASMDDVFTKARQLAPCVMILEDLDSLINDQNRSFFLNQLDGLEGNDGLLLIGTTNHFDRLDPGLSSRPSRFDRKYNFEDPNEHERTLYVQYWQKKLKSNKDVEFPDSLVARIAQATDRFSFAYLKEAFVSALVTLVGVEGPKPTFESVIMKQIDALRKQLDKQLTSSSRSWQLEDSSEHGDSAHGRGHMHRDEHGHAHTHAHGHTHSHGHGHGHGRSARRGGDAAPSARAGMPRAYTGAGSAFIDDEMRSLLDTRVDAARTRLYRARFGADSVLRPDQGPPPPPQSLFNSAGFNTNSASTTSRSGGGGGIGDVRDLLDSLSDSLAAEGDASSTVTQRRFYDGVVPATGPPRLNLDVGSSDFGMPEQPSSAQWSRGGPGGTGFRGLPGGW